MHHRLRVKLVILGAAACGAGLAAATLAACSIDIDGTGEAPPDSGPAADVTTPVVDAGEVDADATARDSRAPDAAPDAASDAAAEASTDAGSDASDGGFGPYAGNMAALFTGDATGFVNVNQRVVQDDFTLEAWIFPTQIENTTDPYQGSDLFVADKSGGGAGDWSSTLYTPNISPSPVLDFITGFKNGGTADSLGVTNKVIALSTWTHVAIVRDKADGEILFYLNGAPNVTTPNASKDTLDSIDYLDIGGGLTGTAPHGFTGMIDEVRVWNNQRTAKDIMADQVDQLGAVAVADAHLVLYYKFDDATNATTTVDSSKSALDGAVLGAASARPTFVPVTGR